jgi:hypothetical protein
MPVSVQERIAHFGYPRKFRLSKIFRRIFATKPGVKPRTRQEFAHCAQQLQAVKPVLHPS